MELSKQEELLTKIDASETSKSQISKLYKSGEEAYKQLLVENVQLESKLQNLLTQMKQADSDQGIQLYYIHQYITTNCR